MKNIRLLPVVVMAIAALLVLKTVGLVSHGSYVLTGVRPAVAAGAAAPAAAAGEGNGDPVMTLPDELTLEDASPTLADPDPTMQPAGEAGGHGEAAPAGDHGEAAATGEADPAAAGADHAATDGDPAAAEADHAAAPTNGAYCLDSDAAIDADGNVVTNPAKAAEAEAGGDGHAAPAADGDVLPVFAASMTDCLPTGDAVPVRIDGQGGSVPLLSTDTATGTEQLLLQRLSARRDELQKYEDDLALRTSIVDAAERRIEERSATLTALEAQISSLVDQRQEMESGQFAGIVAMYESMKPKDAAAIFDNLDMEVLLRVAKTIAPRKMAPILAAMETARAQELTVKMADLADRPATEMSPADLAELPQIVGQ